MISEPVINSFTNIGTAGIAIYVMWKLSLAFIQRLKEKDEEMIQIQEKHSVTMNERENAFRLLEKEVRDSILDHLVSHRAVNERVLETNKEVIELLAHIRNSQKQ